MPLLSWEQRKSRKKSFSLRALRKYYATDAVFIRYAAYNGYAGSGSEWPKTHNHRRVIAIRRWRRSNRSTKCKLNEVNLPQAFVQVNSPHPAPLLSEEKGRFDQVVLQNVNLIAGNFVRFGVHGRSVEILYNLRVGSPLL